MCGIAKILYSRWFGYYGMTPWERFIRIAFMTSGQYSQIRSEM